MKVILYITFEHHKLLCIEIRFKFSQIYTYETIDACHPCCKSKYVYAVEDFIQILNRSLQAD